MSMKRIFVVTEGQSETNFVNKVLAPYFYGKCLMIPNTVVTRADYRHGKTFKGGVSNYNQIRNTLSKTLAMASKSPNTFVTTMFDFYRLPADVPGVSGAGKIADPYDKVRYIEQEIAKREGFSTEFFFPYIELHEFESMLFSDLSKLQETYFEYDISDLFECVKNQGNPEMINDGEETAPSKRIRNCIKCYDKANEGVNVLEKIGVENIARKCAHFSEWVGKIEERLSVMK